MGLDTTHDAWHGAYSSFGNWRNALAEAAGYKLKKVTYGSGFEVDQPDIDWSDDVGSGAVEGEWAEVPEDALLILLCHSDCDGVIHPREAAALADRLAIVITLLPEDNSDEDQWGYGHRARTRQFIDGLRAAVMADEDVGFF
jgi:hypothetical protein